MYKTVRHGENSLQYTILPQTEEVIINSGLRGKGRDYSPSVHVRRVRRRSSLGWAALVALGALTALAFAIVPLYVMRGALIVRSTLDASATPAPFLPTGRDIGKTRRKDLKMILDSPTSGPVGWATETPSARQTTGSAATPTWVAMPALEPRRATEAATPLAPFLLERSGVPSVPSTPKLAALSDLGAIRAHEKDSIIAPTVTPAPTPLRAARPAGERTASTAGPTVSMKSLSDVLITARPTARGRTTTRRAEEKMKELKETLLGADDEDEFKEMLEVDEVFSLPPLETEGGAPAAPDADDVTVSRTGGWYGARWPFVDTSSYFQWTGYSSGDNLLLPLLVAALSSLALVLLLALALRRRSRARRATIKVTRLTAELHEDNTNLLTAENAEDE